MCVHTYTHINTYIYIYVYWELHARYRERFVSPRIPWTSSGDHPWIPDLEARSHDSGPQNIGFERVDVFVFDFSRISTVLDIFRLEKK